MSKPFYDVSLSVDQRTGRLMAVYFRVREGEVADTREIVEGKIVADYDEDDLLLGFELLAPCEVRILDMITAQESEDVKRFVKRTAPHEMVCA